MDPAFVLVVVLVGSAAGLLVAAVATGSLPGRISAAVPPGSRAPRVFAQAAAHALTEWNAGWLPERWRRGMGQMLVAAGEPGGLTPAAWVARSQVAAALGVVVGLAGAPLWQGATPLVVVGASLLGTLLPALWVRDRIRERAKAMLRALPHHLDLLTLVVEGGLDLPGALAVVVAKGRPGPLTEELAIVQRHLRMGRTREEALTDLAERTRLEALRGLVTALVQAERSGSGLAKVLRGQSSRLRQERTRRAEKLAAEAPVKMLLPLVLFIFPAVFLVLLGPVAFQFLFGAVGGTP